MFPGNKTISVFVLFDKSISSRKLYPKSIILIEGLFERSIDLPADLKMPWALKTSNSVWLDKSRLSNCIFHILILFNLGEFERSRSVTKLS